MTSTSVIGTTFFGLDVSGLGESLRFFGRRISRSTLLIEFAPRMLQIAEAKPRSHGIEIKHLSRIALPEGALDRSVPADPSVMAQLLLDLCKEKRIVSHRAAVVLPPELAFQRLIKLPESLSVAEARSFLLDPNNGVTLPFPLAQTDFDLTPMQLQPASVSHQKTYQLTAVPDTLVDPIISMLELSGFELQKLELGVFSTLRCVKHEVTNLSDEEICLLLDFSSEATLVTIVGSAGPIDSERLPSMREFPRFELSTNETDQILECSKSLEDVTIENDRYLPISEMDLRAFYRDLENFMTRFFRYFPGLRLKNIYLTGDGSAHPDLPDLFQRKMNVPVTKIRPLLGDGIRDWSLDAPLLLAGLARLVGLGLGLLPKDPVVITDPFEQNLKNKLLDLDHLLINNIEVESSDSATPVLSTKSTVLSFTQVSLDQVDLADDRSTDVVEVFAEEDKSEWPSLDSNLSSEIADQKVEKSDEVVIEPENVDVVEVAVEEDESLWPSPKLNLSSDLAGQEIIESDGVVIEPENVDVLEAAVEEDQSEWPSLKLNVSNDLAGQEIIKSDGVVIEPEGEDDVESVIDEDESKWPSLKLDTTGDLFVGSDESQPLLASEEVSETSITEKNQEFSFGANNLDDKSKSIASEAGDEPLGELRFQDD